MAVFCNSKGFSFILYNLLDYILKVIKTTHYTHLQVSYLRELIYNVLTNFKFRLPIQL